MTPLILAITALCSTMQADDKFNQCKVFFKDCLELKTITYSALGPVVGFECSIENGNTLKGEVKD